MKKNANGLTEFIPTLAEKRDAEIRNHALDLLQNLHLRVEMLEHMLGLDLCLADEFRAVLERIAREEAEVQRVHNHTSP